MRQITLADASKQLAQLVEAALNGEEVTIVRDNQPLVKLTPLELAPKRRPQFGSAKGLITLSDDFDEPLQDFKEYME